MINLRWVYTKTVVTKKQRFKHASNKKPPKFAHPTNMPYPKEYLSDSARSINLQVTLLEIKMMINLRWLSSMMLMATICEPFLLVHNCFSYLPQNLRLSNKERCFKVFDNMIIDNNLFSESRAVKNIIHQFQQTGFLRRANFRRKISFLRILYFPKRSRISIFSYWAQVCRISIYSHQTQVPSLQDKYVLIRPRTNHCLPSSLTH